MMNVICFQKTTSSTAGYLGQVVDYLVWYAKDPMKVKFHEPFYEKKLGGDSFQAYDKVWYPNGHIKRFDGDETKLADGAEVIRYDNITSQSSGRDKGEGAASWFPVEVKGREILPSAKVRWKTNEDGMRRLNRAGRLVAASDSLGYVRRLSDFSAASYNSLWTDTITSGSGLDKTYVVETLPKVIERCMLMTTDPGDLVLDPTCGSGTTAYVAEKWGRRWITCDTSRVAITLAKQRLMTASFDYFELRYPHEGLKGGFIYKTVPHVTLKSIANNPEIDAIYERMHPAIEEALGDLNATFGLHDALVPFKATEGVRKGQTLKLGQDALHEWEVPFDYPDTWPEFARIHFSAFHSARQSMQAAMDRSIAALADNETLYDQPEKAKNKLRVTGPFTVEAVPFPTVLSLEEQSAKAPQGQEADLAIARTGATSRQHTWRDELLKTGIRGKGGQMLRFAELEVLPGTTCLHASGHLDSGERVVVSFGPEHGALEQRQVGRALNEAETLRPSAKFILFCAFAFDPEAAKDINETKWAGVTLLKAQMNIDLLTDDLKKARSSNQSFWLMGQPDVQLSQTKDGLWRVEVNGFDYFDTTKGELISGGKAKIAAWSLDTDYDGRSLFPHQFFFPMAGKDEGWMKLKKDIRAELDEDMLGHFVGTVSLPFEAGPNATVAVKIVDDRGIESLKVMKLVAGAAAPSSLAA
jgi:adenine-specific DNA-methyltransferase